jgi:hypothetical protein
LRWARGDLDQQIVELDTELSQQLDHEHGRPGVNMDG